MTDYLFEGRGRDGGQDAEVERLESLLGSFAHDEPLRRPLSVVRETSEPIGRQPVWLFAIVACAAAIALVLLRPDPPAPPPRVAHHDLPAEPFGQPAPDVVRELGDLDCTDPGEEATPFVNMGRPPSGESDESPGRMIHQDSPGCRPESLRGCRLVEVETTSGWVLLDTPEEGTAAVDADCDYVVTLDAGGRSVLEVEQGAVTIERDAATVWVPAGNELRWQLGHGPGLPVDRGASASLRDITARFDQGDRSILPELLALLGENDVATLWNLTLRAQGADRDLVLERIDALYPAASAIREAARLGLPQPEMDLSGANAPQ